ncbi:MAG: TetR/AcrR family transcriptional regulator [Proteobacteria bacterium]|nr:TetR/AcrR family transcriptional regulator [Pseudomonadota bacterium]
MNEVNARRPGRPASQPGDQLGKREKILDVAEDVFAEHGYAPTSLRHIAKRASVNPALIAYYFDSKERLFEEVFKRRGTQIARRWHELLDALEARPGSTPSVEELLRAYLTAEFEMKVSGAAGQSFVRLQARVHDETDAMHFRLRREVYDEATQRYLAALERALPNVDPADIYWRMMFIIGAFLYMMSGVDRLDDLSGGRFTSGNIDELVARLTNFVVGGMERATTNYP